jgi:PAS domain S-box-containing protein
MSMIRILLVDDDEDDFVVLRDLLDTLGSSRYQLEWASSYADAQAALARQSHDVYLLDYRLGQHDGLELLREAAAAGVRAPLILLTGQGDEEIDLEAMRQGASDYLVKAQLSAPLLERSIRYALHGARALAELRDSEEGFRRLLDAIFEGVVLHCPDGTIRLLNQPAADVFGLPRESLVLRNLSEFLPLPQGAGEEATEVTIDRPDGSRRSVEVRGKAYRYHSQDARLTVLRDLTQRQDMEAQILVQDRLASVGLLASSLAHEIGTPLGVMRGRAELLASQLHEQPEGRANAEIIVAQIDRISALIRSLLNLARGSSVASDGSVALDRVIQDVVALVGHEFKRRGVRLDVENSVGSSVQVSARAEQLHQVVLNLVVNSLHATESARQAGRADDLFAKIELRDAGDFWELRVEDNGCGISAENMRNLFRPFFTTKEVGAGTGLGLANSYRIVEAAGGSIAVESVEGRGATFSVRLPKAQPTAR